MTNNWMAEAQARCDAATPGPWSVHDNGITSAQWKEWTPGPEWAPDDPAGPHYPDIVVTDMGSYPPDDDDAEFISNARTDLPRALKAIALLLEHLEGKNQHAMCNITITTPDGYREWATNGEWAKRIRAGDF